LLRRHQEIWIALAVIVAVTAIYLVAYQQTSVLPRASGLVGHGIGVLGFVLMLMTETLYSIRKQLPGASWGSMASWLRFHIVTGLVGPYMVLLHTAMSFRGLAGVSMLLTVAVVISGVVGRYLYTAVPRVPDVAEPEPRVPEGTAPAADSPDSAAPAADPPDAGQRAQRLATERGALATWYSIHVPLTWLLFVTALVHATAALYYATLQR
jgi:hypothetical protein